MEAYRMGFSQLAKTGQDVLGGFTICEICRMKSRLHVSEVVRPRPVRKQDTSIASIYYVSALLA